MGNVGKPSYPEAAQHPKRTAGPDRQARHRDGALNRRIVADLSNAPQLEAQRSALTERNTKLFQQQAALANQPAPTSGLATLQAAPATTISKDD